MKKLENEQKDVNRRRDNSSDLEERRKLLKRIQDINIALDKLRIQQLKLRQEGAKLREKELDNLWKTLEPKISEEMIAITHFAIQ